MNPHRALGLTLVALCAVGTAPAATESVTQRPAPTELLILDLEISGDLGGPELAAQHQARLALASARLRESLSSTGLYRLVDPAPAQDLITELKSRHMYLHDCSGCDLDVGRLLGADQVLVAWVNRVSALILTLTYEIHDVKTAQITARKSFGFRGDNDAAWTRAIDYMVRDLKESMTSQDTGRACPAPRCLEPASMAAQLGEVPGGCAESCEPSSAVDRRPTSATTPISSCSRHLVPYAVLEPDGSILVSCSVLARPDAREAAHRTHARQARRRTADWRLLV